MTKRLFASKLNELAFLSDSFEETVKPNGTIIAHLALIEIHLNVDHNLIEIRLNLDRNDRGRKMVISVTRWGDLLDFGQLFKTFGNN